MSFSVTLQVISNVTKIICKSGNSYTTNSSGVITVTNPSDLDECMQAGCVVLQTPADALTATAGGGQTNALALSAAINRVTTVATAADSVKLPVAVPGAVITVINAAGTNSMNVFPATGEVINALAANAAFAIAAGKTATFSCAGTKQWHSVLSS
jgi:hypothetical protein